MGQKPEILESARKRPLVSDRQSDSLTSEPETAALYVHFPFCNIRCGYCDFYTVTKRESEVPAFLAALYGEIVLYSRQPQIQSLQFETIYFGGGTPSLLLPNQIIEIIGTLRSHFKVADNPEITLETNPGTVDRESLSEIWQTGVNRLSIGVQSFHAAELRFLDRDHSAEDAIGCIENGRHAGFDNISIDLIWGLPEQKLSAWERNLRQAVALRPDHISAYNLTYEEGTPLTKKLAAGRFRDNPEDIQSTMQMRSMEILRDKGYEQYEISNFARPGFASRHNKKYWDGSSYLGLGPSAHSMLGNRRFWNPRSLRQYTELLSRDRLPTSGEERLGLEDRAFEMIFLGLRQRRGIDLHRFEAATGIDFYERYGSVLTNFFGKDLKDATLNEGKLESKFLTVKNGFLRLTDRGVLVCDAICRKFC